MFKISFGYIHLITPRFLSFTNIIIMAYFMVNENEFSLVPQLTSIWCEVVLKPFEHVHIHIIHIVHTLCITFLISMPVLYLLCALTKIKYLYYVYYFIIKLSLFIALQFLLLVLILHQTKGIHCRWNLLIGNIIFRLHKSVLTLITWDST